MNRAQRLKTEMQLICKNLGIQGEIKNNGLHWQFSKNGVCVNFFPTTNKITLQGPFQGKRFTFNVHAFMHRSPIILIALKELGGTKFIRGFNGGPPVELPQAKERGSCHFAGFERYSVV